LGTHGVVAWRARRECHPNEQELKIHHPDKDVGEAFGDLLRTGRAPDRWQGRERHEIPHASAQAPDIIG
jgi:hypothetical protein